MALLITSPNFSAYYVEFRNAVVQLMNNDNEKEDTTLGREIDQAFIRLLKVSFCRDNLPSEVEDAFQIRLATSGSVEKRTLESIVGLVAAHEGTF